MAGKSDLPSKKHTFGPDRTLEDSAGAKGEGRKRAVDADRTGGGERPKRCPSLTVERAMGMTILTGSDARVKKRDPRSLTGNSSN